eukprot:TRINITY_DN10507_c0_g2_i1.p1 TRINITY_DN10507_c0_g2~~TRINITY_DN10507_c0_g2_i1.p1  ORF type:complete len:1047 (+),score=377.33 TRINITY_DN10507_c0_g2_i1:41-3181(+)
MAKYFQKPENALKRALECEKVGKPGLALDTLHDLLTSRKHKQWTNVHEDIMHKFLDLCMELKRGFDAKDGLHQFKNIAGTTALSSFEKIIKYYLDTAEAKVAEAWQASKPSNDTDAAAKDDQLEVGVEDLEEAETPETILLAAVSAEDDQDRANRVLLTPWLKYLWEAYRTVLDLLRNNNKMEHLYHGTARQAFKFCLKYDRRQEFRRLCSMLSNHLQQLVNPKFVKNAATQVDLAQPDTIRALLETRFEMVVIAGKLDQWQEAYRGMEEVANLLDLSPTRPSTQIWAVYYHRLAQIFWCSNDYAFHAGAWQHFFSLTLKDTSAFQQEEVQYAASSVLLATLTVPLAEIDTKVKPEESYDPEAREHRQRRLAELLNLTAQPTRSELIDNMTNMNIMSFVNPKLKDLFSLLEEEFHPLQLCQKTQPIFEFLAGDAKFEQYVKPLQYVVVMRLLKQLSQLYTTLKLDRLVNLVPFCSRDELETIIIQAVQDKVLSLRINHVTQSIYFGVNPFAVQENTLDAGPRLQAVQADNMNRQLTTLSRRLYEAMTMIEPTAQQERDVSRRQALLDGIDKKIAHEHMEILQRRRVIEERKEELEAEQTQRQRQEMENQQKATEALKRNEAERLAREAEKRERRRLEEEKAQLAKERALEKLEQVKKTASGARAVANIADEQLEQLSAEEIEAAQLKQKAKEMREFREKMRSVEKRIDYYERAKRLVEIPKLKAHFEKQREQNLKWHQERQHEKREKSKKEHAKAMELKAVFVKCVKQQKEYADKILGERRKAYEEDLANFQRALAEQEDAIRREEEERRQREAEEAEKLAKQRELERQQEEKRAKEAEERRQREEAEAARRKAEEDERRKKLDELAELQRQREQEIEERLRAKQGGSTTSSSGSAGAWRPARSAGGSTWRSDRTAQPPSRPPASVRADGGDWRRSGDGPSGPPARGRDFGGPRRDERSFRDERGPRDAPRRDFGGRDAPRRDFGGRDGPRRDDRGPRDGPPRRDFGGRDGPRRDEGRQDGGAWRRGGSKPSERQSSRQSSSGAWR